MLLVADETEVPRIRGILAHRHYQIVRSSGRIDDVCADDLGAALVALPLHGVSGADVLRRLRQQRPTVPVIVIGTDHTVPDPPAAFELGAADYVSNPVHEPGQLLYRLGLATGARKHDAKRFAEVQNAAAAVELHRMVGRSPAMQSVLSTVRRLCSASARPHPMPVMLTGETGTGKNLIAQAIHYNGARRSRPFVHFNCAGLTAGLAASELFGHAKGAFTDAKDARDGLFVQAHHGTLFLDEITELPPEIQATLLLATEQQRVRPVGATDDVPVDVQLIVATNADLPELVQQGGFRRDVYERLSGVPIHLPSLRERPNDIIALAESLLAELTAEQGEPPKTLDDDARELLETHFWPSNVRELRKVLKRVVSLEPTRVIRAEHLLGAGRLHSASLPPTSSIEPSDQGPPSGIQPRSRRASGAQPIAEPTTIEAGGVGLRLPGGEEGISVDDAIEALLREAQRRHPDNLTAAARWLGWTRDRYVSQLRAHGLKSRKRRRGMEGD